MSAPDRIYLQGAADAPDCEAVESGITWCWHQIDDDDVAYVRADLAIPSTQAVEDTGEPVPVNYSKYIKWPEGYCLDPNGVMCCPDGKREDWVFGYDLGYADALVVRTAAPPANMSACSMLTDIEQYRMQMAGISTAALGYWKEGDEIHPDYDTRTLRDVAKLYAKYAANASALSALRGCVDVMLSKGVPVDPEHPARIALTAAEAILSGVQA